jgi:hypothetical protein
MSMFQESLQDVTNWETNTQFSLTATVMSSKSMHLRNIPWQHECDRKICSSNYVAVNKPPALGRKGYNIRQHYPNDKTYVQCESDE